MTLYLSKEELELIRDELGVTLGFSVALTANEIPTVQSILFKVEKELSLRESKISTNNKQHTT